MLKLTVTASLEIHRDPLPAPTLDATRVRDHYAELLRKCGRTRAVSQGKKIHLELQKTGHDTGTLLGNLLVQMYGKFGSLQCAQNAFERITRKNVYSWTLIILAYAQNGHPLEALRIYEKMGCEGAEPDRYLFSAVLGACCRLGALEQGRAIHTQISARGLSSDVVIQNSLLNLYARSPGCLQEAREVFESLRVKDVIAWNSILAAYAQYGHYNAGLELYHKMDIEPEVVTFVIVLGICSSLRSLTKGKMIHKRIISEQLESDLVLQNSLLNMYSKCGSITEAREIFERISRRDLVSWNAMIAANAQCGHFDESLRLMRSMDLEGVKPDSYTFSSILLACTRHDVLKHGKAIFSRAVEGGLNDPVTETAAFNMYAKCGNIEEARCLFETMKTRDSVSWSAMISCYAQFGRRREALEMYRRMCLEGMEPDTYTFSSILQSCSETKFLQAGKEVHARVSSLGLETGVIVGTALVNMYAECGEIGSAKLVFDRIPCKDTAIINALLLGYVENGQDQEAIELYKETHDLSPDSLTYASVLEACANLGAVTEAKTIHEKLDGNIVKTDCVVGTALIDMYARCGRFDDAKSVFKELNNKDQITWNAMLAAYAHVGLQRGALEHMKRMVLEGVGVNEISFNNILHACSHGGLLEDGCMYFASMRWDFGVIPNVDNFHCVADLLARSGQLREAEELIEKMPFEARALAWKTLLSGCSVHSDKGRGERAAEEIIQLEDGTSAPYVLLSGISA